MPNDHTRTTLMVSDATIERIEYVAKVRDHGTRSDAIRAAVRVYAELVKRTEGGGWIVVVDEQGEEYDVVLA